MLCNALSRSRWACIPKGTFAKRELFSLVWEERLTLQLRRAWCNIYSVRERPTTSVEKHGQWPCSGLRNRTRGGSEGI